MKKYMIKLLLLSLLLMISTEKMFAVTKILDAQYVVQERTNWCWDASIQAVLKYYAKYSSETQCQIAETARSINSNSQLGITPCCSPDNSCDQANILPNIAQILTHYNINCSTLDRALLFSEIIEGINTGHPILVGFSKRPIWGQSNNILGHMVVIIGYSNDNNQEIVYYIDPKPNEIIGEDYSLKIETFSEMLVNETILANEIREWFGTIKIFSNKPQKPTNLSPSNSVSYYTTSPVLRWNPVAYATEYEVVIANNEAFTNSTSYTVTTNTYILANAQTNTQYYWKVRAKNSASVGLWSLRAAFSISQTPLVTTNTLSNYEYWHDGDYANKVTGQLPAAIGVSLELPINYSTLGEGLHLFNFRVKDMNNNYSQVLSKYFYKRPNVSNLLASYEYWLDNNYEQRQTSALASQTQAVIEMALDYSQLSTGLHIFNFRTKDNNGNYSSVVSKFFYKNENMASPLVSYEYWVDTNLTARQSVALNSQTLSVINFQMDCNQLPMGLHTLNFRTKDANGNYSAVVSKFFYKNENLASPLNSYEYWLDSDYAGKQTVNLGSQSLSVINLQLNYSQLSQGLHIFNFRAKDANGNYSAVVSKFFYKNENLGVSLSTIEYWFDSNYEQKHTENCSGTTVAFNQSVNMNQLNEGLHIFNIRYKDAANRWSAVKSHFVYKSDRSVELDKIAGYKYWFDDNTSAVTSVELDNPVSPYHLNTVITPPINFTENSSHRFNIQFRSTTGKWSAIKSQNFGYTLNTTTMYPILRSYLQKDVDHFYCVNQSHLTTAINGGYKFEKTEGYVFKDSIYSSECQPIFRLYGKKDKSHFYTTSLAVKNSLLALTDTVWISEGVLGSTINSPGKNRMPMYYLYKYNEIDSLRDHFYTTSEIEKRNAIARGYTDNGIAFYVFRSGGAGTMFATGAQPTPNGVNLLNGTWNYPEVSSFNIKSNAFPLSFSQSFNSFSCLNPNPLMTMGRGWSHNYHSFIELENGIFDVYLPGGDIVQYDQNVLDAQSNYKAKTDGVYSTLRSNSASELELKTKDQIRYIFTKSVGDAQFDKTYCLTKIIDRNDNYLTLKYKVTSNQILLDSVISSSGNRFLALEYSTTTDQENLLKKVKDVSGRFIQFEYDANNLLTKFYNLEGLATQYSYLANSDNMPVIESITLPKGNKIKNQYESTSRTPNQTARMIGQSITGPDNTQIAATTYTKTAANAVSMSDASGNTVNTTFDIQNRMEKISDASGETKLVYGDPNHKYLTTQTSDAKGNITDLTYDAKGNILNVKKPCGVSVSMVYNSMNDVVSTTDAKGVISRMYYDAKGNLIRSEGWRDTTTIAYYANGAIDSVVDPLKRATKFTYNQYGNPASVRDNLGNTVRYEYDALSRTIKTYDAKNNANQFFYKTNDMLDSAIDAMSYRTKYNYDANGNLLKITDPRNNATNMFYNLQTDVLDSVKNKVGLRTKYEYYPNFLLKKITKPNDQAINYEYDNIGRLNKVITPSRTYLYSYDANGNVLTAAAGASTITFNQYDSLDRIKQYSTSDGDVLQYEYDLNSNISKIIYPGNKAVEYTYYPDNLMESVRDWNNQITRYVYRADGSLDTTYNGNGTKTIHLFDNAGRMIGLKNTKSNGDIISKYFFVLDSNGNQVDVSEREPLEKNIQASGQSQYTYDAANRISTAVINGSSESYSYNNNGWISSLTRNGSTTNFIFDAENTLNHITGASTAEYVYDAMGNRTIANRNGVMRRYVHDLNSELKNVLIERDANGNVLNYFIYGAGLVSRIKANNQTHYYHYDYRGSTIAMTDANQNITHKYSYGLYGELLNSNEPAGDANMYRYVGKYGVMDEAVASIPFYYMRARYYDPKNGRFLSEDPIWSNNLYSYAGGNPGMAIDPKGEATVVNIPLSGNQKRSIFASQYTAPLAYFDLQYTHEHIFFDNGGNIGISGANDGMNGGAYSFTVYDDKTAKKYLREDNKDNQRISNLSDESIKLAILLIGDPDKYEVLTNNCQQWVTRVLDLAKNLTENQGQFIAKNKYKINSAYNNFIKQYKL